MNFKQEYNHFSDIEERSNTFKNKDFQNDIYPVNNGKVDLQKRRFNYSITGLDATKITYGILLIFIGMFFTLIGFIIYLYSPEFGLILILFPGIPPIFIGYTLLKRFMDPWEIIKAIISSFIVGLVVYLFGVILFLSTYGGM